MMGDGLSTWQSCTGCTRRLPLSRWSGSQIGLRTGPRDKMHPSLKAAKARGPAHRPNGPVAAREWDVAHAAALRALLTEPSAVLPNQVRDPLLPLQIGIRDALLALLRPGAEPELWYERFGHTRVAQATSWPVLGR